MRKLRIWLLPEWAQPEHPLLQYELSQFRGNGAHRGIRLQLTMLTLLVGGSAFVFASTADSPAPSGNVSGIVWQSLYYPTLILQTLTLIVALLMGAAAIGTQRSRKTWDNVRVTELGAGLALRTRWVGILYRLRAPIGMILLVRFILALGMLFDLTAFGGHYAEMLSAQATPPLPDWRLGLLLIALVMTVNILLPLLTIATTAVLGILLSVAVQERIYAAVIQILLVVAQLVFTAAALLISQIIQGDVTVANPWKLALFFGYSGIGDWGLLLAQLGSLGEIWHRVPFGAAIPLGLTILLIAQGLAADGLMWLAERLSESHE